jgi:hypothetical protein
MSIEKKESSSAYNSLLSMDISSYSKKKWKDRGKYFEYLTSQRSEDWHLVRIGRISGSRCGACLGHSNFSTSDNEILKICKFQEENFSENSRRVMQIGIDNEPKAVSWYSKNYSCQVSEVGFVVPKWNFGISYSPDGVIFDQSKIIEIKCPEKMYYPIEKITKGGEKIYAKYGRPTWIWQTHYDQMQLGMEIFDMNSCDYIVYCEQQKKVYVETISRNQEYWKNEMKPILEDLSRNKIPKLLSGTLFPLCPETL